MVLITAHEAAEILGVAVTTVYDLVQRGHLTRHARPWVRRAYDHAEVEALSLSRLTCSQPWPHLYWASTSEAAAEFGNTLSCPADDARRPAALRDCAQRPAVRAPAPARRIANV